jgi:transcriptional regulator with XRE-family HTH domain
MSVNPIAMTLRAKKLGVLMQDARRAVGKSAEACAQAMSMPVATYEDYELGEGSPSLPQLEMLAFFLNVPLEHFWGTRSLSETAGALGNVKREQLLGLRQRKIGVQLRQARLAAGLSLETAAAALGISSADLENFEFGEQPIPLPVLEALASMVNRPLQELRDQRGPVGTLMARQASAQDFLQLPPDLLEFASQPVNRPYLEVARRLSEMSTEKLRSIAEGLLEITL